MQCQAREGGDGQSRVMKQNQSGGQNKLVTTVTATHLLWNWIDDGGSGPVVYVDGAGMSGSDGDAGVTKWGTNSDV